MSSCIHIPDQINTKILPFPAGHHQPMRNKLDRCPFCRHTDRQKVTTRQFDSVFRSDQQCTLSCILCILLYLGMTWPWVWHDLGTTWIMELSLLGTGNESSILGTFAPAGESSLELSLPGTKVPGNFRPGSESSSLVDERIQSLVQYVDETWIRAGCDQPRVWQPFSRQSVPTTMWRAGTTGSIARHAPASWA